MLQTLQIVIGFLRRPRLYPELFRRVKKSITPGKSNSNASRDVAQKWCDEVAVTTEEALQILVGHAKLAELASDFGGELDAAKKRCEESGVVMGGAGNCDLLYGLAEYLSASRVIETGVAYGWSSLAILLSLEKRNGARLVSTDMPYLVGNRDRFVGVAVPDRLKQHWTILPVADRDGIPDAVQRLKEIDLCHYDSDKSYDGRMWAYGELWKCLRPEGIFISDDIENNLAFKHFSSAVGVTPIVIRFSNRFVGVIRKPHLQGNR